MQKEEIQNLVEAYFQEKEWGDCFFVSAKITGNRIEIFIDRDGGISFDICAKVSRRLEELFDQTLVFGEKYTLEVSSPGIGSALLIPRQYINNIGRLIEVKNTESESFKGLLKSATDEDIVVEFEEVIKEGKKKRKEMKSVNLLYSNIAEAKIKISFK